MTHRLHYIDNLKGVLILLVVLGHCIQCTDHIFYLDLQARDDPIAQPHQQHDKE